MDTQVAEGFDNEGDLEDLTIGVDPRCEGIERGSTFWAGDNKQYEDGYRIADLIFDYMTKAQIIAFMTQVGLSDTVISAEITIRLQANITRTLTVFNAVIHAPNFPDDAKFDRGKYVNVKFPLSQVREAA